MTDALQFVFGQLLKTIFISIPGIIESYDSQTKRCKVKPAINMLLTDGSIINQSAIVNVPVLWPSGGGFTLLTPLPTGTPVEIKFSQRGITKFKETFSTENPGNGVFDKEDAHVIPGYGGLSVSPATEDGISMQSENGNNYIFVEDGNIEIKSSTGIKIEAITTTIEGQLIVNGGLVFGVGSTVSGDIELDGIIKGANVFNGADSDLHKHGGVTSGGEDTGVPV